MTRVSTQGNYNSALLNLMFAQTRQNDAQQRLATGKVATDLQGFGRGAETLTALKGAEARIQGFVDTGDTVLARLDTQDLALTRISSAVEALKTAIGNAIANDSGASLDLDLNTAFQDIRGGLNAEHQGRFVFGGGNVDEAPVATETLVDYVALPAGDTSTFKDGSLPTMSRVSEATRLNTGFRASDLGADVFEMLKEISGLGPFANRLTAGQKTDLAQRLTALGDIGRELTANVARNGTLYKQVETINQANSAQLSQLETLVGKRTDADLAQAAVDIKLSEVAIQASAQVINSLRQTSLLNFLT